MSMTTLGTVLTQQDIHSSPTWRSDIIVPISCTQQTVGAALHDAVTNARNFVVSHMDGNTPREVIKFWCDVNEHALLMVAATSPITGITAPSTNGAHVVMPHLALAYTIRTVQDATSVIKLSVESYPVMCATNHIPIQAPSNALISKLTYDPVMYHMTALDVARLVARWLVEQIVAEAIQTAYVMQASEVGLNRVASSVIPAASRRGPANVAVLAEDSTISKLPVGISSVITSKQIKTDQVLLAYSATASVIDTCVSLLVNAVAVPNAGGTMDSTFGLYSKAPSDAYNTRAVLVEVTK